MAIEKFQLELISKKDIAPKVKSLLFKRADGKELNFIAGQFVTFMLYDEEGTLKRRSYSLGSLPEKTMELEIAISYLKGGIASETFFNLNPGEKLDAMGPAGRLVLKDEEINKLVLVGTGTGIVPYRAMFPELLAMAEKGIQIDILLGVQHRQDGLYADDFINFANQHANLNFILCLSREESELNSYEKKGYVQSQFDELSLNPETDVVYLCGNPNMIDNSYEILLEKGFNSKNVRREKYISK